MAITAGADDRILLVVGQTGGGKSLWSARHTIQQLLVERRVLYTNLELKFPVLQRFIGRRAGPEVMGLLRELREDHFRNFMQRYALMSQTLQDIRQGKLQLPDEWERRRRQRGELTLPERRKVFFDLHGPHRVQPTRNEWGDIVEEGNWIPAGSCVLIDEVQNWFPNPHIMKVMSRDQRKDEPVDLLKYLTMHRHLGHALVFVTQRPRQVSPTLKSLAHEVLHCRNRKSEKIVWGLTYGHVSKLMAKVCRVPKFPILGYVRYEKDDIGDLEEMKPRFEAEPIDSYNVFPVMPWWRWLFKIYNTQTHAGSARDLRKEIEAERVEAGLLDDGFTQQEMDAMSKKESAPVRMMAWLVKTAVKMAILGIVLFVVLQIGRATAGGGVEETAAVLPVSEVNGEASDEAGSQTIPEDPDARGRERILTSVGPDYARLRDGTRLRVGAQVSGLEVAHVDVRRGVVVCVDPADDQLWAWAVGEPCRRIGSLSDLVRSIVEHGERDAAAAGETAATDT